MSPNDRTSPVTQYSFHALIVAAMKLWEVIYEPGTDCRYTLKGLEAIDFDFGNNDRVGRKLQPRDSDMSRISVVTISDSNITREG